MILILVYIVMASQFESFTNPGIIMFTVPFALSGVILALWITGVSLDMIGALGIVLLVGIVVKNGIVLVDYINLMRERGMDLNEAIQVSGQSRMRPVLMTAFTTILGMVPMAVSQGEGAEMWRPLGIVVIGGCRLAGKPRALQARRPHRIARGAACAGTEGHRPFRTACEFFCACHPAECDHPLQAGAKKSVLLLYQILLAVLYINCKHLC